MARSGGVWLHGSSVGEARVVGLLARELRRQRPERSIAVSAYTPTGRARLPSAPDVDASFYIPLDFPGYPDRLLRHLRPRLLGLIETELWPNLLHDAHRLRVPVAVLNGRLSTRRMARYRRFAGLYRPGLGRLVCVGAQSNQDAEHFTALGVPPDLVRVTGNIKYDLPLPETDPAELRARLGLGDRPVFAAGSTRPGEEQPVLDAFARARRERARLCLLLAPRHLQRIAEVEELVRAAGLRSARLSSPIEPLGEAMEVLLVDTLGELPALYRLAAVAFVGGSLAPLGGHSPLEPAAVGVPVLFGPHTEHFDEPASALEQAGGARRVHSAAELGEALVALLADDGARTRMGRLAAGVVDANRGALAKTVTLLIDALEAGP
jgi:3-deoxy-D-manno-octulosonic-acid transferase